MEHKNERQTEPTKNPQHKNENPKPNISSFKAKVKKKENTNTKAQKNSVAKSYIPKQIKQSSPTQTNKAYIKELT